MSKFIKSWTAFTKDSKVGNAIMKNIEEKSQKDKDND